MKKITLNLLLLLVTGTMFAGGIQHNTNQSAQWVRTLCRDASTEIDAVFYNPAGLTKLSDGLHISLNVQTLFQSRSIKSENPILKNSPVTYEGTTVVPALPTFFAAYKTGKLVISGGFEMIGGGGSAEFPDGLPSFEGQVAVLPSLLTASGIPTTDYSADVSFSKTVAYMGFQLGASYEITPMISVYAGARYVMASQSLNNVEGYLKNTMINPNYPTFGAAYTGDMVSAPQFFTDAATFLNGVDAQVRPAGDNLQPLIVGGAGDVALANGTSVGLTPTQVATLQGTITATGGNPAGMTIKQAQDYFYSFKANADGMTANAELTKDAAIDVKMDGNAITPIFGANLSLMEDKLNIGIKYELGTEFKLKNHTTTDDLGLYVDGEENNSDLPAMLTVGANYKLMDNFAVTGGFHYYSDLSMKYYSNDVTNEDYLNGNATEYAFAFEYGVSEKLLVSAGYLYSDKQLKDEYQTDITNNLTSGTVALGAQFKISDALDINIGGLYTFYLDNKTNKVNPMAMSYKETYDKTNLLFAVGIGYRLGK